MGVESASTYGRASELCSTTRLTIAGDIKATAGKLYWLLCTNSHSSNTRDVHLNNDAGTENEILKIKVKPNSTGFFNFDPPIPCSTGIRIGTLGGDMIVTGGYV